MTDPMPRRPPDVPRREAAPARRDMPIWRQVGEGIGLVVVLSAVVAAVGGALALVVSLLF